MSVESPMPIRPNLWTDRLASYAFAVEAAIGRNPMRYLVARCFENDQRRAITVLFVLKPDVLYGTFVWVVEDTAERRCVVHTYLPTMAGPLRVADELVFDCLPLTDVGYLDLMAWPHPMADTDVSQASRKTRFGGTSEEPAVVVSEAVDESGIVVRRVVHRGDRLTRTWEVVEHGSGHDASLTRRIRVARPETGHVTEFVRTGDVVAVPSILFDEAPEVLRSRLVELLGADLNGIAQAAAS